MQIFDKEINGSLWKTKELDGDTALTLAIEIMQIVGPALSTASKNWNGKKSLLDQTLDPSAIVKELLAQMQVDKTKSIIKRMLSETWKCEERANGFVESKASERFGELFRGKKLVTDLFPVLLFVFKTNFGDFSQLAGFINAE